MRFLVLLPLLFCVSCSVRTGHEKSVVLSGDNGGWVLLLPESERPRSLTAPVTLTVAERGAATPDEPVSVALATGTRGRPTLRAIQFVNGTQLATGTIANTAGTIEIDEATATVVPSGDLAAALAPFAGEIDTQQLVLAVLCGTDPAALMSLTALQPRPALGVALEFARRDIDGETIRTWRRLAGGLTDRDILTLVRQRVDLDTARSWLDWDADLDADGLLYAVRRRLDPAAAHAWEAAGYELDIEELYYARTRRLDPQEATAWRRAGYELTLKELYYARTRRLDPQTAKAWKQAGFELDLEGLYHARTRRLDPAAAIAWREAGYDLDLDELHTVAIHRLDPATAKAWKNAGYSWSIEDLQQLQIHRVGLDWAKALGEGGKHLSRDEIIKLRRSNVDPAALRKLTAGN